MRDSDTMASSSGPSTDSDENRRRFLIGSATAVGLMVMGRTGLAAAKPLDPVAAGSPTAIRPFRIDIPEAALLDMRQRITATRWPDRETVPGGSQGLQLERLQALCDYWARSYDWRKIERRLNALPQYMTQIDGLEIHFLHIRSRNPTPCRSSSPMAGPARSWR